jgi:hypothetical protein
LIGVAGSVPPHWNEVKYCTFCGSWYTRVKVRSDLNLWYEVFFNEFDKGEYSIRDHKLAIRIKIFTFLEYCPVCHAKINLSKDDYLKGDFTCGDCGQLIRKYKPLSRFKS